MDGRGRALDNVFVERLWRSVTWAHVYLNDYQTMVEARNPWSASFQLYHQERPHHALRDHPPREV